MRGEQCTDLPEKHCGGGKYHHAPHYTQPPSNLHTKAPDKGDTGKGNADKGDTKGNANKGDTSESNSYKGDESTQPKTETNLKAETWEEGEI